MECNEEETFRLISSTMAELMALSPLWGFCGPSWVSSKPYVGVATRCIPPPPLPPVWKMWHGMGACNFLACWHIWIPFSGAPLFFVHGYMETWIYLDWCLVVRKWLLAWWMQLIVAIFSLVEPSLVVKTWTPSDTMYLHKFTNWKMKGVNVCGMIYSTQQIQQCC